MRELPQSQRAPTHPRKCVTFRTFALSCTLPNFRSLSNTPERFGKKSSKKRRFHDDEMCLGVVKIQTCDPTRAQCLALYQGSSRRQRSTPRLLTSALTRACLTIAWETTVLMQRVFQDVLRSPFLKAVVILPSSRAHHFISTHIPQRYAYTLWSDRPFGQQVKIIVSFWVWYVFRSELKRSGPLVG